MVVTEESEISGLGASGGGFVIPLRQGDILTAVTNALVGGAEMGARARKHVLAQDGREAVVAQLEGHLLSVADRESLGGSCR